MSASSGRPRWLARIACPAIVSCLCLSASAQQAETPRRLAVRPPTGEPVLTVFTPRPLNFELALNEVEISGRIRNISGASGPEDLLRVSAALKAETPGGEVGWILYEPGRPRSVATRAILTREIGLLLDPHVVVDEIVRDIGPFRAVPGVEHAYVVEASDSMRALELVETLQQRTGVRTAYSLLKRQMFTRQEAAGRLDRCVRPVSRRSAGGQSMAPSVSQCGAGRRERTCGLAGCLLGNGPGTGSVIAIVDNGLQHTHPDLQSNYSAALSFDFNDGDPDPSPIVTFDFHGTAVTGIAAARGGNGFGVSGAAPLATLAGLRLIAAPFSDATGASALGHQPNAIHISNNSWGPFDDGATLEGPGPMTEAAIRVGCHHRPQRTRESVRLGRGQRRSEPR